MVEKSIERDPEPGLFRIYKILCGRSLANTIASRLATGGRYTGLNKVKTNLFLICQLPQPALRP